MTATVGLSVLIPAHNEAAEIAGCLTAVFASKPLPEGIHGEVLVLANGCTDQTASIAKAQNVPPGWSLIVLEISKGGKLNALNQGDRAVKGNVRVYLDADVRISPDVLTNLYLALSHDTPAYAAGNPMVVAGQSVISRAYGRFWVRLPFITQGVPGFGLFAMNNLGRNRWADWPEIIADDTFARLMFSPNERHQVAGTYHWPLVQGFRNLVRVRRRQNQGVKEIEEMFPALLANDDKHTPPVGDLAKLLLTMPVGFLVYAAVSLAVKTPLFKGETRWARGR